MKYHQFYTGEAFDAYDFFGAHLTDQGVLFRVYAPAAQKIEVIGEFNGWQSGSVMVQDGLSGIYELLIPEAEEGQMYKYRIHKEGGYYTDHFDPYSFGSELRPGTASRIVDTESYHFEDQKWMDQRSKNYDRPLNIYEVHAGSWRKKETGDEDDPAGWYSYDELADMLAPYVREMGYTHVEFLPLTEHPSDQSWGYQVSGYFCPTSRYGTAVQLMKMVDTFHREGIGVILDFVPVHFVINDYVLKNFDGTALYEYDSDTGYSEWGTCNFNYYRGEVRSLLQSSADFFLTRFHFDGIRMDAISNAIYWQGNAERGVNEGALEFIKCMNAGLQKRHPTAMLIAEDSTNYPGVTHPVEDGGLGFDYKWDMGWMNDTLDYFRIHPNDRKYHYNDISFSMMYYYNERYLLPFSHDEVVHGKATILQKMWGEYDVKFQQAKTLYTYMYTHPGKKLSFMGNEIGHFREWDEKKECDWFLLEYPKHDAFRKFLKDLHSLYVEEPAFWQDDYRPEGFRWLEVDAAKERVYIYERMAADSRYIVVLNMSQEQYNGYEFGYDKRAVLHEVISGERVEYDGYYDGPKTDLVTNRKGYKWWPYSFVLTIPALASIIYRVEMLPEEKQGSSHHLDEASLKQAEKAGVSLTQKI